MRRDLGHQTHRTSHWNHLQRAHHFRRCRLATHLSQNHRCFAAKIGHRPGCRPSLHSLSHPKNLRRFALLRTRCHLRLVAADLTRLYLLSLLASDRPAGQLTCLHQRCLADDRTRVVGRTRSLHHLRLEDREPADQPQFVSRLDR